MLKAENEPGQRKHHAVEGQEREEVVSPAGWFFHSLAEQDLKHAGESRVFCRWLECPEKPATQWPGNGGNEGDEGQ